MGILNTDIEDALIQLPDQVADCLLQWRKATLDREKTEANLYLVHKAEHPEATSTEIKARINSSDARYNAFMLEAQRESEYNAKYETLMAFKKRADLRTAY